ncbi:MAG: AAA family ATPase [Terrimicrobiaceae bacterium]|nr:AAA family ATPase [Terrimicrobiaceae bacterium]
MRIDRIELTNFKCFEKAFFDFDPEFTLFVGDNGTGKTSILSAVDTFSIGS